MKKAYTYIRISTSEQSNFSLTGQAKINQKYAEQHGIEIINTYEDDGVSGKNFNRPAWKKMMKDLKKKEVSFIIVSKYDRLGRNAGEALGVLESIEASNQVRVLSAMEHFSIDPDHPFYFKMRADMLVNAEFERRVIRERTKFGIWNGRSEGRHLTGAPFGYENQRDTKNKPIIVPHPINRHIVTKMFTSFLEGATLTQVYKEAKQSGFTLRSKMATTRLLSNPIYAGKIIVPAFNKEPAKMITGIHTALVSEDVFLQVQNILFSQDQKHQIDRDELPLRGWLACGCGKPLTGAKSKSKTGKYFWYYRCNYCPKPKSFNAEKVDEQIEEILSKISLSEEFIDIIVKEAIALEKENQAKNSETVAMLNTQIKGLREKMDSIEDKYINDKIEESTYKKWKPVYLKELHEKINQLEDLQRSNSDVIGLIVTNTHLLSDLGLLYKKSAPKDKQKLVKTVFSHQLQCFGTHYETPYMSPLFLDNVLKNSLLHIKKDAQMNVFNNKNCISTLYDLIIELKFC